MSSRNSLHFSTTFWFIFKDLTKEAKTYSFNECWSFWKKKETLGLKETFPWTMGYSSSLIYGRWRTESVHWKVADSPLPNSVSIGSAYSSVGKEACLMECHLSSKVLAYAPWGSMNRFWAQNIWRVILLTPWKCIDAHMFLPRTSVQLQKLPFMGPYGIRTFIF